MKFKEFKNIDDVEIKLLKYLDILYEGSFVFKLDNFPNYDLSGYDKSRAMTYFFEHEAKLPSEFNMVTSVEVVNNVILHTDDIHGMSKKYNVENDTNDREWTVNEIYKIDDESLGDYSCGLEFDGFKLNQAEVKGINNSTGKVLFSGSFVGNYEDIQPYDWDIYSECRVVGAKNYFEKDNDFYRELMAESYNLMLNENFKLSYFLAFSSLESYINGKMNTNDEKKGLKIFYLK